MFIGTDFILLKGKLTLKPLAWRGLKMKQSTHSNLIAILIRENFSIISLYKCENQSREQHLVAQGHLGKYSIPEHELVGWPQTPHSQPLRAASKAEGGCNAHMKTSADIMPCQQPENY